MVIVRFMGPAAEDFAQPINVQASDLKELAAAFAGDEVAQKWLKISAVAVGERIVSSLDYKLQNGDEISILPPVCGG